MAYRKYWMPGHRIAVETKAGRTSTPVVQIARCSCGWTTGAGWKPHREVTLAVDAHVAEQQARSTP